MKTPLTLSALGLTILICAAIPGCSSSQPNLTPAVGVTSDPAVDRILAGSCYECHSTEGASQWYAKLQPSRWFGNPALDALNLSNWQAFDDQRKKDTIRQIAAAVDAGTMPPKGYLFFHPHARLSVEDKMEIARWAAKEGALAAH